MLFKRALVDVVAASSTPVLPVPTNYGVLTPEQIKAGCTLNMAPPFRPECQAAGAGHSVHAGATPTPNAWPDIDAGCSWDTDNHILPDCHLRIGFRPPDDGSVDDPGDPQLPPEDSSTALPSTPYPEYGPRNWTRYDELGHTNKTSTGRRHGTTSPTPIYVIGPSPSSPSLIISSSGLSPSSGFSIPSSAPTSSSQSSASTPNWSSSSHGPGPTSSEAHSTVSSSHSSGDTISSPTITSPPSMTSSSSTTTISSDATHSSTTVVSSGTTSLPNTASSSNASGSRSSGTTSSASSSSPLPTASPSPKTSSTSSSATNNVTSNPSTASKTSPVSSSKTSSTSTSTAANARPTQKLDDRPYVIGEPAGPNHAPVIGYPTKKLDDHGRPVIEIEPLRPKIIDGDRLPTKTFDDHPTVVVEPLGPSTIVGTGLPTKVLHGPPTVVGEPKEMHRHITAVLDGLPHKDKDHKHLALGLAIGVGAGIPAAGLVRWLGTFFKTVSTMAKGSSGVYSTVMKALRTFNLDNIPHYNFNPNPKTPADDVAESVDEWYDELCRQGNTGEQAAEIINNFEADMARAEAYMANQGASIDEVVGAASGATFSNPSKLQSWSVQAAAQVASTPGSSTGEVADSLLKAGVPADAVEATAGAVSDAISQAPKGWIGRPAFNAALGVISSAVSSAGAAGVEAAKAAVNGASGPGLAFSLGPAGVPAAAADATAQAMKEAIQAAKASGADPVVAAINVISNAASPAGLASAAALTGATGSSLAPALSAAGVPTDALGPTADAVADAISAAGGSASVALSAASGIIANAAGQNFERLNSPAPPVSIAQAALDVVGASFNFWHIIPWLVWDTLSKMDANASDSSDADDLARLLAMGPPPEEWPSRFETFPYRRGGDRITGLPSLPTDVLTPTPIGTHHETHDAAPTLTPTSKPTTTLQPTPSSKPTQTLAPAPPGTGGYLFDGTTRRRD